ncbi:hypothetical protein GCM10027168_10160 [Streptomyces capparidis]
MTEGQRARIVKNWTATVNDIVAGRVHSCAQRQGAANAAPLHRADAHAQEQVMSVRPNRAKPGLTATVTTARAARTSTAAEAAPSGDVMAYARPHRGGVPPAAR